MSEQFQVGGVAIAQHWELNPEYNGQEVIVTGALQTRICRCKYREGGEGVTVEHGYEVRCADGRRTICRPYQLRKRPEPPPQREDLQKVQWEDCLWQPKRIVS